MKLQVFKSKIHRATITESKLDYEGSITIDADLMRAADILPYEAVHVWNITNGSRLLTYAIKGPAGKGGICVNGAGARLCKVGDLIIIATFEEMSRKKASRWEPKVVLVNEQNRPFVGIAVIGKTVQLPKVGVETPSVSKISKVLSCCAWICKNIGANSTGPG